MATEAQINELLDQFYLQLLALIERHTDYRVQIEKLSKNGQLLLAKTRYVQGTQTVSVAQIPTENGNEFKALCRVSEETNKDLVAGKEYKLERHAVDKANGYLEPLHWFGVLAPNSLRQAAEHYKRCVKLVVESANVQKEMAAVMDGIEKLEAILAKRKHANIETVDDHKGSPEKKVPSQS